MGLDHCLRITIGAREENDALLGALRRARTPSVTHVHYSTEAQENAAPGLGGAP